MKTIKEWLETLPEPYREQALNNSKEMNITLNSKVERLTSAISFSFIWSNSPEGFDYWWDLIKELKGIKPKP